MKRILPIALLAALTSIVVGLVSGWAGGSSSSPQPRASANPPPANTATSVPPTTTLPSLVATPKPPPSSPLPSSPSPSPSPSPSFNPQDPKDLSHLDPQLRAALVKAMAAARADGVTLQINSGWRSAAYQEQLWQDAIRQYGSAEKAHMWVLPPEESDHVKGKAVDIGPWAGAAWMQENGARFGLCPKYANEHWHFEYRTKPGGACPATLPHP